MKRNKAIYLIMIFFSLTGSGQNRIDEKVRVGDKPAGSISIYLGTMVPSSLNSVLGFHPLIGASIGARKNKMSYSVLAEGRFGNTRKSYTIKNKDIPLYIFNYLDELQ